MAKKYIDIENWKNYSEEYYPSFENYTCFKMSDLKKAINNGFDVNTLNKHGVSILEFIYYQDFDFKATSKKICLYLLEHGANIRAYQLFTDNIKPHKFEIFLNYELSVDSFNEKDVPYYFVRWSRQLDWEEELDIKIFDKLLEAGFDINAKSEKQFANNTILHETCKSSFSSNPEKILYLLDKGANPFIINDSGQTAYDLYTARRRESSEIVIARFESIMANWKGEKPKPLIWDWSESFWLKLDAKTFKSMLDEGYSQTAHDDNYNGILWYINEYCSDKAVFELAVEYGLLDQDEYGSVVMQAAENNEPEILEFWLSHRPDKADVNYFNKAVFSNPSFDLNIGKILIEKGEIDLVKNSFSERFHYRGYPPLIAFLQFSHHEKQVRFLVEHGADPLQFDGTFRSSIDYAVVKKEIWGENGIIEFLHQRSDKLNPIYALKYGNLDEVKDLYENRQEDFRDIDSVLKEANGSCMYMAAAFNQDLEVIKYLVDQKEELFNDSKKLDIYDRENSYLSAYVYAAVFNRNLEIIKYLEQFHPENYLKVFKQPYRQDQQPFFFSVAAYNPNPEVIQYFIDKGNKVNDAFKGQYQNYSPLFLAITMNNHPNVIKKLLQNKAKVDLRRRPVSADAITAYNNNEYLKKHHSYTLDWLQKPEQFH